YCYVDNPKGKHYASEVAAPLFQEIAAASVLHLGLVPNVPIEEPATVAKRGEVNHEEELIALSAPEAVSRGLMPDFRGLTMAEVRPQMPSFIDKVRFVGSGRVVDQTPPAGSPLEQTAEVVIVFEQNGFRPEYA